MAVTPEKKTWIEFYEALVAREATSLTMEDPIWVQKPSVSQAEKEAFIEESNKKIELEEVRSKFVKFLQALKLSMEEVDIKRHAEEYVKLLPLARLSYVREQNGDVEEQATKLILAFGTANKAIQYLKKFENKNPDVKPLVHDACLFTLPRGEWDIKLWQELAKRYMLDNKFKDVFGRAGGIQGYVVQEKKNFIERIKNKIKDKWELRFGEGYENIYANLDKYIKFFQDKIDKQVNYKFSESAKGKGIVGPSLKDYRKSEEGQGSYAKIKEEVTEMFRQEYSKNPASNSGKQEFVEQGFSKNSKVIDKEIEREVGLILSSETPLETLIEYFNNVKYERAVENPKTARIFSENGMTEEAFNLYLSLTPRDSNRIPPLIKKEIPVPILVQGSEMGYSDKYYLTKLSPSDPRCAILGKLTSCCQHLDNAGRDCARHGIESEEGGFYILCERTGDGPSVDDPIISQCWAWRSQTGALVFDSVESKVHYRQEHKMMISDFFTLWAHKLVTEHNIPRVAVGASVTPESLGPYTPGKHELPIDYEKYRDSHSQRIIADKSLPFVELYRAFQARHGSKWAVEALNTKILARLLIGAKELGNEKGYGDKTLLMWAVQKGDPEIVSLLLQTDEAIKTLHEVNASGLTALMLAAYGGYREIISMLIQAEINKPVSISDEWFEQLKQFFDDFYDPMKSSECIARSLELSKQEGFPIFSFKNDDNETVLMLLARRGKPEELSAMLKSGAEKVVNLVNGQHRTALMLAAEFGNAKAIPLLFKAGAEDLRDIGGQTALLLAAYNGKSAAISALVKESVDVLARGNNNITALHNAVDSGKAEAVAELLKAGAGSLIYEKDAFHNTPLSLAESGGKTEIVNLLKTELERLEKEKFEKETKEIKASAEVAQLTAPPVIFTSPPSSQAVSQPDILKEAAEFRELSKRMGPVFEQFKAKLGLTRSDVVEEIGEQQIKIKAENGSIQSFDIQARYQEQQAKQVSRPG